MFRNETRQTKVSGKRQTPSCLSLSQQRTMKVATAPTDIIINKKKSRVRLFALSRARKSQQKKIAGI